MACQVDICIATFKRPALLRELLDSLCCQELIDDTTIRIVVVDNDKRGSAREVVKCVSSVTSIPVVYVIEPIQNISRARNRAVSMATCDYAAFIDDDEKAAPDWIKQLLVASKTFAADVVFGPVVRQLPKGSPKWIIEGDFFKREQYPTGALRPHGATSNALVKMQFMRGIRFCDSFGLSGGEDIELFARMKRQKAKMVWCDEAIVYEKVAPERVTFRWLVRRSFRGGQTVSRIFFSKMTGAEKTIWFAKRITGLLYVFMVPLAWLVGKHRCLFFFFKAVGNIGQLTGLSKFCFKEYAS